MACSNSLQIPFDVDFPRPNCNPQLLQLLPVASRHSARPTLSSTLTGDLNLVCCFCKFTLTRTHKYSKVSRVTLKCSFQRKSRSQLANKLRNQFCGQFSPFAVAWCTIEAKMFGALMHMATWCGNWLTVLSLEAYFKFEIWTLLRVSKHTCSEVYLNSLHT